MKRMGVEKRDQVSYVMGKKLSMAVIWCRVVKVKLAQRDSNGSHAREKVPLWLWLRLDPYTTMQAQRKRKEMHWELFILRDEKCKKKPGGLEERWHPRVGVREFLQRSECKPGPRREFFWGAIVSRHCV